MHQPAPVIAARDPQENSRPRTCQRRNRKTRVLQRFPRSFEQEALLWIHADGLALRDPEECRVELIDSVKEAAPTRVGLAANLGVGIVELLRLPAGGWRFRNRVAALAQKFPEGLDIWRFRKAAGHSDDGYGIIRAVMLTLFGLRASW